jgi:hypothetical protein
MICVPGMARAFCLPAKHEKPQDAGHDTEHAVSSFSPAMKGMDGGNVNVFLIDSNGKDDIS